MQVGGPAIFDKLIRRENATRWCGPAAALEVRDLGRSEVSEPDVGSGPLSFEETRVSEGRGECETGAPL